MPSVSVTDLVYLVPPVFIPIFDAIYPHFGLLLQKKKNLNDNGHHDSVLYQKWTSEVCLRLH